MSKKKKDKQEQEPINALQTVNPSQLIKGYSVNLDRRSFTPTKFKSVLQMDIWQKLQQAGDFFTSDGVVQNIFITQAAMGCRDFEHVTTNDNTGKVEGFYDEIARRLKLRSFLRWFYLAALIYSNVFMVEFWGEMPYTWGTKRRVMTVPVGLALVDPLNGRILGSSLRMDYGVGLKVELNSLDDYSEDKLKELNSQYKYPIFDTEVKPMEVIKYVRRSGNRIGDQVFKFNNESASHFKLTGFDWERYGEPKLCGCFPELQMKKKLQEADFAVADGIINMLYVFKLGNDELGVQDGEQEAFYNLLKSPSRTFNLIWNHRLEVDIVSPDRNTMVDPEKYAVVNDGIREALGYTFGMSGLRGRRDIDKLVKMFCETIDAERGAIAEHFEQRLYRRIAEKNNLSVYPKIKFNKLKLATDDLMKVIIGLLYDRGLVSKQSAQESADVSYEEERGRRINEKSDVDKGIWSIPELPFSRQSGGNTTGAPRESTQAMSFDNLITEVIKPRLNEILDEYELKPKPQVEEKQDDGEKQ